MDYDFSRLSTRSFEQLIQALSLRELGSGLIIFGDGPDGGREATFEGAVSFPSSTSPWNGYGVIQAKFKQRSDGTGKDTDWALKDLEGELKKFTNIERKLRTPEYYIFVTNVTLSSVADKGGKDKATKLIDRFKSTLGLKDFRVWDYDQLRTMLDTHKDIRTTYNAWIMPGDVLSTLLTSLELKEKNFKKIMRNFVQKELRAEQYVKLGQADHNEQERIPLAKVFVDLPVSPDSEYGQSSTAMRELLFISGQLLKSSEAGRVSENSTKSHKATGRIVFVGGPGQGKSTLTQFFCQTHRVALLELENNQPTNEVQNICKNVKQECETENFLLPSMPRFPIRVELNQFATTLANGEISSLFDYILQRINSKTSYGLETEDLRKWLEYYPWLVALDGLDEVPSSSNRIQVLDAVQDFLIDAHDCNADLLIISTTRPQGYNDDFSPKEYQHFQLAHLNTNQALHYAKRLINQKWVGEEDKIQMLLGRMQRASTESATARLMRSPLQVTIMALLVESLGEPPKERWKLFSEYYRVINTREKERDIPAARLLGSYQTDIDTIHQQVGLKLQTRSERSGGTDALLTIKEFDEIVETRLNDEGYIGNEADILKRDIVSAAMERLVFLVAPKQENIGFEIRSLQEYMAAECLMNIDDETKRQNLRAIMFASHWRNVFLFAAGRCFHKEQHLRSDIVFLCNELNEGDISSNLKNGRIEKLTLAGSRLALEILEDGAIGNQPNFMRNFLRLALRLLELPPSNIVNRLADLYDERYSEIFNEETQKQLSKSCKEVKISAWQFLIQIKIHEDKWINDIFERDWPKNKVDILQIIKPLVTNKEIKITSWISKTWANATLQLLIPKKSDLFLVDKHSSRQKLYMSAPDALIKLYEKISKQIKSEYKIQNMPDCFSIILVEIQEDNSEHNDSDLIFKGAHPTWSWVNDALDFWINPSTQTLCDLLERYWGLQKEYPKLSDDILSWPLPWPLKSCIKYVIETSNADKILKAIADGDLGVPSDWLQAQDRWKNCDISTDDILHYSAEDIPFDKHIATIGYPANIAGAMVHHAPEISIVVEYWYDLWTKSKNTPSEKYVQSNFIFLLSIPSRTHKFSLSTNILNDLSSILNQKPHREWVRMSILDDIQEVNYKTVNIDKVLQQVAEFQNIDILGENTEICKYIESQLIQSPDQPHLLKILVAYVVIGYKVNSSLLLPVLEKSDGKSIALIRLACINDFSIEDIDIGSELLELYLSNSDIMNDIITTIKSHKLKGELVERSLCTLFQGIAEENWVDRQNLLEEMREQQQNHLSYSEYFS